MVLSLSLALSLSLSRLSHPCRHASSISARSDVLFHLEAVSCAAAEMAREEAPVSKATRAVLAARVIRSSCLRFSTTWIPWDEMGWDGMKWDGMGWDGME